MGRDFKPGDIVFCVKDKGTSGGLTLGKRYEVLADEDLLVKVCNDKGRRVLLYKHRFSREPLPRARHVGQRDRRLLLC